MKKGKVMRKILFSVNVLLLLACVYVVSPKAANYIDTPWSGKAEESGVKQEQTNDMRISESHTEDGTANVTENEVEDAASVDVIVEGQYPIMGQTDVTAEQMAAYFHQSGAVYPVEVLSAGGAPDIETFCQIYCEEAEKEGVRSEVAFAQTMKETGWLQYGGDAEVTQYNFAGLGTTGNGVQGNSYADVREGVRAQIQHLKAYATDEALNSNCVDTRYSYVTKGSAPYVEWLGQQENPEGYGWATGENYGYDIVKMIQEMKNICYNER